MAKDQPPAFMWYPRDFAASISGMTDAQELAYRRALDRSWLDQCYGVGQPALWRRWSGASESEWESLSAALIPHVEVQPDGTWAQVRMARERMEQELYARAQSERGRSGGLASVKAKVKRRSSASKPPLNLRKALPLPLQSAVESQSQKKKLLRRAPPNLEISPQDEADMVARFGLSQHSVSILAERVRLEAPVRGYVNGRSALLNWCKIEVERGGHTNGVSREAELEAWVKDDPEAANAQG